MTITNGYASLAEAKKWLSIPDNVQANDANLELAVETASRSIDMATRRKAGSHFWLESGASARIYYPDTDTVARIDDFDPSTAITVLTDENDDGVFESTWVANDYQIEPLNRPVGWAAWTLRAVGNHRFPTWVKRACLQVTAKWGWPSVPTDIKNATLVLAEDFYKSKDAPFGVAGWGDTGVLRVRDNATVARLISPFVRMA